MNNEKKSQERESNPVLSPAVPYFLKLRDFLLENIPKEYRKKAVEILYYWVRAFE
jgi:hypothetical protein